MTLAKRRSLSPGLVVRAADTEEVEHGALRFRIVPPPSVPTSSEGMETKIWREPWRLDHMLVKLGEDQWLITYLRIVVIQLALSTTWAGSCPVARKIAATMFAA